MSYVLKGNEAKQSAMYPSNAMIAWYDLPNGEYIILCGGPLASLAMCCT